LLLSTARTRRDLPSFPTRRSSDLGSRALAQGQSAPVHRSASAARPVLLPARLPGFEPAGACLEANTRGSRSSTRLSASERLAAGDRKSTRLNSSHVKSSYAVFCLK